MPEIGRVFQDGPMVRIRETGESNEQQAKRCLKLSREREGNESKSYAFVAARAGENWCWPPSPESQSLLA
jgi:hypothetical protein